MVEQQKILVNGIPAVMGQKVSIEDEIIVNGKPVEREREHILIAFNKPVGIECTSDLTNPDNIIDYIGYPILFCRILLDKMRKELAV